MKKSLGWLMCLFIGILLTIPMPGLCQGPFDGIIDPPPAPKQEKQEPVVTAPRYPLVEILAAVDRAKFVGEQNIVLKTEIVFYQQVSPFWEELTKVNFSPFKLEKTIRGERKIFDREKELTRDCREVTFLLSLPASSVYGPYTIPSFSLGYSDLQGKIKGTAKSKAIKVEKVPILVTIAVAKDTITIGEHNTIRLTVWREKFINLLNQELKSQAKEPQAIENESFQRWLKSLEVRNQKITDFDKPDFPGFKMLNKKSWTEQQGSVIMEVFEYLFAFYELGGKEFPLPKFHIWYLNKSQEEKSQKPKEIVTPPLVTQINLVVRPGRKTLEWLKSPEPNRKNNIYYFGYGPMALGGIFFLVFAMGITISFFRSHKRKVDSSIVSESPCEIKNRILSGLKSDKLTWEHGTLLKTRNELFKLFGSITGIPANMSMAKTNSQMLALLEQAGFPKDQLENIKSSLLTLDKIIQHYDTVLDPEPARELINNIITNPGISHFLKKRKFWNFRS